MKKKSLFRTCSHGLKSGYDATELHWESNSTSGATQTRDSGTWRTYILLVAVVRLDLVPDNTHVIWIRVSGPGQGGRVLLAS